MPQHCPISLKKSDTITNRIATSIVVAVLILFLYSHLLAIMLFLIIDFLIRIFGFSRFSPIYLLSSSMQKALKLEPKLADDAPKKFAMVVGFIFIVLVAILFALKLYIATIITAVIYIICALLDIIFGFCIACLIYPYVARFVK